MKIAVIGSGGVGGYFGARLAAAGTDVTFVARGSHLEAMQNHGLQIYSALGDLHLDKVNCTADTASIGQVDVVMIAVKLWATDEAVAAAKPLIGPDTAVVSFQNGIVAADVVRGAHGDKHTMGGVAAIAALIEEPGVIRHNGQMASLLFGELDGSSSSRAEALLKACTDAGIQAKLSDDVHTAIWQKFVMLATMSSMTALCRMPIGPILKEPSTRGLLQQVMETDVHDRRLAADHGGLNVRRSAAWQPVGTALAGRYRRNDRQGTRHCNTGQPIRLCRSKALRKRQT
jgi:2-dehydropantoate 2-reductase